LHVVDQTCHSSTSIWIKSEESKGDKTVSASTEQETDDGRETTESGRLDGENGWVGQTKPAQIVIENEVLPQSKSLLSRHHKCDKSAIQLRCFVNIATTLFSGPVFHDAMKFADTNTFVSCCVRTSQYK